MLQHVSHTTRYYFHALGYPLVIQKKNPVDFIRPAPYIKKTESRIVVDLNFSE